MKNKILSFAVVASFAVSAFAQNQTTVSGSKITDLNQQLLPAGQICFLGTDNNDNPISFQQGGGGQVLKRQFCSSVAAGVISAFTVPNPAATLPSGISYRVTVKDSSTGAEVLRYTGVSFSGATFNFDNYTPNPPGFTPAPLSGTSVTGNLGVTGNISATGTVTGSNIPANILQQVFNQGAGLTQRTGLNCLAGLLCADNAGTGRTDMRVAGLTTVAFSATPTFDASIANAFKITLTGNVTSSTLSNAVAGEPLAFEVCQDAVGGRTFVPPTSLARWIPIGTAASDCSLQFYTWDGAQGVPLDSPVISGDVAVAPHLTSASQVIATHLSAPLPATQGGTAQNTYAIGDTIYASAANTLAKLSGNTTTTKKYLQQVGTGTASQAPSWQQITAADIAPGSYSGATMNAAGSGNAVTLLNSQDNTPALTGNGTDQIIYSYTIPANTVQAGKCFHLVFTMINGNSAAVSYKLTLGATNIFNITSNAASDDLTGFVYVCNNAGVQNAQRAFGGNISEQNTILQRASSAIAIAENLLNATTLKLTFNVASPNTVTGGKWMVDLIR